MNVNGMKQKKSCDCPCHGSRYSYEGDVIDGPGLYGLNKLVPTQELI
jgi:Rieske Fe-S protein